MKINSLIKESKFKESFKRLFPEIVIIIWNFLDILMPNFDILSRVRGLFFSLFWDAKKLAIMKGNRVIYLGNLNLGKRCFINKENIFDNDAKIIIGNNCLIGFRNLFLTVSHVEKGKQRNKETIFSKPITIGNNVWITSNCTILPGTVIGDNVILSAGSVAKGTLESGWVYSGNPAVKVRKTKGALK
jgi:acetyltransferase-like isoleucine patch superfamily enzyme